MLGKIQADAGRFAEADGSLLRRFDASMNKLRRFGEEEHRPRFKKIGAIVVIVYFLAPLAFARYASPLPAFPPLPLLLSPQQVPSHRVQGALQHLGVAPYEARVNDVPDNDRGKGAQRGADLRRQNRVVAASAPVAFEVPVGIAGSAEDAAMAVAATERRRGRDLSTRIPARSNA